MSDLLAFEIGALKGKPAADDVFVSNRVGGVFACKRTTAASSRCWKKTPKFLEACGAGLQGGNVHLDREGFKAFTSTTICLVWAYFGVGIRRRWWRRGRFLGSLSWMSMAMGFCVDVSGGGAIDRPACSGS